mgnify:CR=1 FL=1
MDRFWSKVDMNPHHCWEWLRSTDNHGYGQFSLNRRPRKAHIVSYMLTKGEIPKGQKVRHTCDNPPCVNPDHLILGTQYDNVRDMVTRGRHGNTIKTHCKNNHEFTEDNTYYPPHRHGTRDCRTCHNDASRRYKEKKKNEC